MSLNREESDRGTLGENPGDSECMLCLFSVESNTIKELLDTVDEPRQFVELLDQLPPSRRFRCLLALILRAVTSLKYKDILLSLPEPLESDVIEELRSLLDDSKGCEKCISHHDQRMPRLRRLLVTLSQTTGVIPRALFLHGVTLQGQYATASGGFGDIFRALYRGEPVAVKRVRTYTNQVSSFDRGEFHREAIVSWLLDHPNVQPFLGVDGDNFFPVFSIVSPWQRNGNMLDCLKWFADLNLPILIDVWVAGILAGLCYLHDNNIVHGDLRAGNVLVNDHYIPLLTDLGLSNLRGIGSTTVDARTQAAAGTIRFTAPEFFNDESTKASFASDIYAFGCVCIELYARHAPFPNVKSDGQVIALVIKGSHPSRPLNTMNAPDGFWDSIEPCWSSEPRSRPSAHSLSSSLPLRSSPFSLTPPDLIPHTEWRTQAPRNTSHPNHRSHDVDDPRVFDPCLLYLLNVDTHHGIPPHEVPARISTLGGPEEVVRFAQEMLGISGGLEELTSSGSSVLENSGPNPSDADVPPEENMQADPQGIATVELAASARIEVARLYGLGRYAEAIKHSREAIDLCHLLVQDDPDRFSPDLSECQVVLANSYSKLGQMKDVVSCSQEAVGVWRDVASKSPERPNAWLASSLHWLAYGCRCAGDRTGAVQHGSEAVEIYRELVEVKTEPRQVFSWQLAIALRSLADTYTWTRDDKNALRHLSDATEILRELVQQDAERFKPHFAGALFDLASTSGRRGKRAASIKAGLQSLQLYQELAHRDPSRFSAKFNHVMIYLTSTHKIRVPEQFVHGIPHHTDSVGSDQGDATPQPEAPQPEPPTPSDSGNSTTTRGGLGKVLRRLRKELHQVGDMYREWLEHRGGPSSTSHDDDAPHVSEEPEDAQEDGRSVSAEEPTSEPT